MTNNSTLIEAVIAKKIKTAEGFSVVLSKAAKQDANYITQEIPRAVLDVVEELKMYNTHPTLHDSKKNIKTVKSTESYIGK